MSKQTLREAECHLQVYAAPQPPADATGETFRCERQQTTLPLLPTADAIQIAVEAERQACAKVCDDIAVAYHQKHFVTLENVADECSDAIRARGAA